ncbi:hypothetical protein [Maridesulfovibrio sp.]|uniref:hypothetical protein n=1 Tax=Maridesulfovibrio sp. TaxID=2795000 RepID=UPI002A18CB21|nr:hypothetical protein [Maridesulfovibrio sp.]
MPTIENLRITYTSTIYRKKSRITKKFLTKLFTTASSGRVGHPIINEKQVIRGTDGNEYKWSCLLVKFKTQPTFLENTPIKNEIHGYLLLIEHDEYVFIFKDKINDISTVIKGYLEKINYEELCSLFQHEEAAYESITLNSLNTSPVAVRSKKLEAMNLKKSISRLGTNRQIPKNLKKRTDGTCVSITPVSSRISSYTKKASVDEIAQWTMSIVSDIKLGHTLDDFLQNFAEPISYEQKRNELKPLGVFFDLNEIEEDLKNSPNAELYWLCKDGEKIIPLKNRQRERLFTTAKNTFVVEQHGDDYTVKLEDFNICSLNLNKKTITATGGILKNIIYKDDFIEEKLHILLRKKRALHVSFDDHKLLYCNGNLFQDTKILRDIEGLLSSFITDDSLVNVKSEKGFKHLTEHSTEFHSESLFYFVENIYSKDDFLICDDLGDEWADHIGFKRGGGSNPEISFYISKHKHGTSSSASQLQDVIGQAQKNIGRIFIDTEEFKKKITHKWAEPFNANKITTKISRIRKNSGDIVRSFEEISSYPNTVRQMVIVADFISKSKLQKILVDLKTGIERRPHYTQLFWILSSFMGVCQEMGVRPLVVCAP